MAWEEVEVELLRSNRCLPKQCPAAAGVAEDQECSRWGLESLCPSVDPWEARQALVASQVPPSNSSRQALSVVETNRDSERRKRKQRMSKQRVHDRNKEKQMS